MRCSGMHLLLRIAELCFGAAACVTLGNHAFTASTACGVLAVYCHLNAEVIK